MAQIVQLKRSALSGKVPGTGSLNLGELALNTYDGKIFFRRSGSTDTVQEVITTNVINTGSVTLTGTLTAGSIVGSISASNGVVSGSSQIIGILSSLNFYTASYATTGSNQFTGSQNITGSLRATLTGSFGSLNVNDTLNINHGIATINGSLGITSDLTVLGQVNARQFNISVISSSVLFESGSSRFGNSSDDTHQFTGSVNVTGSLYLNGIDLSQGNNSGSFSGSFQGDGSRLRGVISDDIPRDGYDYNSNITGSGSISDFNVESDKYYIDFAQSQSTAVGTPVGFKGFLTNVSGSTQILPTLDSINFIVRDTLVASIGVGGIIATAPAGTISGSSQLTSSYDGRYVLSGSITQTTWDNIASKPGGIVSGSSQVIGILSSLNTYTGSQDTKNSTLATYTASLDSKNLTLATYTASLDTKFTTLANVTSSLIAATSSYETKGRGIVSGSSQITFSGISSLPTLVSGSSQITYANISSIPTGIVSGSSQVTPLLPTGVVSGSSQILGGSGLVSGSSQITFNGISSIPAGIVSGSLQTIANLPTGVISGSIQVLGGSGIISSSAQLNNTTITNLSVTNLTVVNETASVLFSSGSNRFGDFGDDVHDFTGSVKISGSITTIGASTATSFNGIINATNGVVSGSSQITYANISSIPSGIVSGSSQITPLLPTGIVSGSAQTIINLPTGTVSGSSQVIGILSSLNTYTGSQDTKNSTLATYTASLDSKNLTLATYTASLDTKFTTLANVTSSLIAATSSYETKGRSIVSGSSQITFSGISSLPTLVSGSSQIDAMSTTNIARLATTGSNIFIGNQTITGSIFTTGTGNNLINAVTTQAFASGFNDSVFILAPNQTGGGLSFNIGKSASSYNLGKMVFNYVGDQSTSNNISFGFYNYDNKLVIEGGGTVRPGANGTQDLGSASNRWSTVYTSDLSLNNGIGDWTIVEGEDDLFLYNNKKGKVYKFALTEVGPNVATPKKS